MYSTPADGGVAVGTFAPVSAALPDGRVVLVDTDYPATDRVTVLLSFPAAGDDAATLGQAAATSGKTVPLRVRVPGWAVDADAYHNGVKVTKVENGTMLLVGCAASSVCNVTLDLNPKPRIESSFGNSVSVYRGPILFGADLGRNYTKYSPQCEQPPFDADGCPGLGPGPRPASAGWWGAARTRPYNLALVIKDRATPDASLGVEAGVESDRQLDRNTHRRGTCAITGDHGRLGWPACVLSASSVSDGRPCVRVCNAAGMSPAGLVIKAAAHYVASWTMANGSAIEALPPPRSPACATKGACSTRPVAVELVPFAGTDLRIAAFPVA